MHCVDCGELLVTHEAVAGTWVTVCDVCYDGTEDSSPRERVQGRGRSPESAVKNWYERREET